MQSNFSRYAAERLERTAHVSGPPSAPLVHQLEWKPTPDIYPCTASGRPILVPQYLPCAGVHVRMSGIGEDKWCGRGFVDSWNAGSEMPHQWHSRQPRLQAVFYEVRRPWARVVLPRAVLPPEEAGARTRTSTSPACDLSLQPRREAPYQYRFSSFDRCGAADKAKSARRMTITMRGAAIGELPVLPYNVHGPFRRMHA